MPRPFWSGQIQISLVSFGVKLFPATEAKSEIHFHEIDRRTGTRVRHQKIAESDESPVNKADIVKGYEYRKGEYVQIDPKEIEHLRIPSKHTLQMEQFVDFEQLDPALFEKPYFVVPEKDNQAEAFAVVREALKETRTAGLGKIAMGGREHLMAVCVPADAKLPGLMAYTLRYADELRSAADYFSDVKSPKIDAEQLSLAKELIQRKAGRFDPSKFTDDYEAALRELVKAKMKHLPLPLEEKPFPRARVINLMDALRRSVKSSDEKPPAQSGARKAARDKEGHRRGLTLLKSRAKPAEKRRRSA